MRHLLTVRFFDIVITCGDNERCSNSKVRREITRQEQSEHGPLQTRGSIKCQNLSDTSFKGRYWPNYAVFQICAAQNIKKGLEFIKSNDI